MIKAQLATSRHTNGNIYIIKANVNYFREGHDCNHTIVGFNGIEHEIYMKIDDFRKAIEGPINEEELNKLAEKYADNAPMTGESYCGYDISCWGYSDIVDAFKAGNKSKRRTMYEM